MEPVTAIAGLATVAGGFLKGFMGGGGAPSGPAISSAMSGGTLNSPFNVGSGVGSPSQIGAIGGAVTQWAPWIVVGVVAWAIFKK